MAPRQRNAREVEVQTSILHLLNAIHPKIGALGNIKEQRQLMENVIKQHRLPTNAEKLRAQIFGAVARHPASPGSTKGSEIFTKPADEVFSKEYLDSVGYKLPLRKTARKRTMQPTKPASSLKLTVRRPVAQTDSSSTNMAASPVQDHELQSAREQSDDLPTTGRNETGEKPIDDGDAERTIEETPSKQGSSSNHRSPATIIQNQPAEKDATVLSADATARYVSPVNTNVQRSMSESRLDEDAVNEDSEASQANLLRSSTRHSSVDVIRKEHPETHVREKSHTSTQYRQQIEEVRLAKLQLEAEKALLAQGQERLEKEKRGLENQLSEFKAQDAELSTKKRAFDALQTGGGFAFQPAAKRSKTNMATLQKDSLYEIQDEMKELNQKNKSLADMYCDIRDIDSETKAEFLVNPSPELEQLYRQIHVNESGHSWKQQRPNPPYRAHRALRCLIGAGIYQSVFRSKSLWENEAADDQTFAGLTRYLFTNDDDVREAAYQRIKNRDFQNGEVAQYAEKLTWDLSVTLEPHLNRMMAGRRRVLSTDWIDELRSIIRAALIIKAKIDVYHDGDLEASWPLIGSKMNPVTTDHERNEKQLAYEVVLVFWPGLQMKVEGKPDVILSRDQVAAKPINNAEN